MNHKKDKKKVEPVGSNGSNEEDDRLEIFEEQYDANQEFRIFGIGDKTKGGVQSLQEKMNMADDVQDGDSSDSNEQSDDGYDKQATAKDAAQMISEQLAVMENNPQSRDENHRLNHSAGSTSSKQGLLASNATPNGSVYNSEFKNIALPEDNEIIDEEEEEEEE